MIISVLFLFLENGCSFLARCSYPDKCWIFFQMQEKFHSKYCYKLYPLLFRTRQHLKYVIKYQNKKQKNNNKKKNWLFALLKPLNPNLSDYSTYERFTQDVAFIPTKEQIGWFEKGDKCKVYCFIIVTV